MDIQFIDAVGLRPYLAQLRELEGSIPYPIGDGADSFTIDHGEDYTRFFTGLGDPRFLIAVDRGELCGIVCGILRRSVQRGRSYASVYGSDLKLAKRVRGTGLWKKMLWKGFFLAMQPSFLLQWRIGYVAAMRGDKGDVMRTARGLHAARLAHPAASLAIYFVEPERLARLDLGGAPPPPRPAGLDFSPDAGVGATPAGVISTAGRKDLRLRSTGEPWPLQHLPLGPAAWSPTHGAYLRAAGASLLASGQPGPCCFSLDQRLADHVGWLASRGITSGATCNVYTFRLPIGPRPDPWVHLATSEI